MRGVHNTILWPLQNAHISKRTSAPLCGNPSCSMHLALFQCNRLWLICSYLLCRLSIYVWVGLSVWLVLCAFRQARPGLAHKLGSFTAMAKCFRCLGSDDYSCDCFGDCCLLCRHFKLLGSCFGHCAWQDLCPSCTLSHAAVESVLKCQTTSRSCVQFLFISVPDSYSQCCFEFIY